MWRWLCRYSAPFGLFHCWHYFHREFTTSWKAKGCVGEATKSRFEGFSKCCHCETYRWSHGWPDDNYAYSRGAPFDAEA